MNLPCEDLQHRLSALIDGELAAADALAIEEHLEKCGPCRSMRRDLLHTRGALGAEFASMRAATPPLPQDFVGSRSAVHRRPWLWNRVRNVVTAASVFAAATLLVMVVRGQHEPVPAAELIQRVMAHQRTLTDAEVSLELESQVFRVIQLMFSDKAEESERVLARGNLLLKAPSKLLLRIDDSGDVLGYDGRDFWAYDPEVGKVSMVLAEQLDAGHAAEAVQGATKMDLSKFLGKEFTQYLSWRHVLRLVDDAEQLKIEEITTPSQMRAERRVFRVTLPRTSAAEKSAESEGPEGTEEPAEEPGFLARVGQMTSEEFVLTIDPSLDLIERVIYDFKIADVGLFRVTADLVGLDQSLEDALFDHREHVPEGTEVVVGR